MRSEDSKVLGDFKLQLTNHKPMFGWQHFTQITELTMQPESQQLSILSFTGTMIEEDFSCFTAEHPFGTKLQLHRDYIWLNLHRITTQNQAFPTLHKTDISWNAAQTDLTLVKFSHKSLSEARFVIAYHYSSRNPRHAPRQGGLYSDGQPLNCRELVQWHAEQGMC